MPLDELNNLPQPVTNWPPLDPSLLGDSRSTPPAFPLHLFPGPWRPWVEASSRLFGSADYLAHCLLGGVACVAGAGLRIEVASHWREPLLLWQALVGGPSSGKSAAFARVRALLDAVKSDEEASDEEGENADADEEEGADWVAPMPPPEMLVDVGLDRLALAGNGRAHGVLVWREDLSDWMEEARRRPERHAWLAGWSAAPATIDDRSRTCFAVSLLGALSPEGLSPGGTLDSALASRVLYAWPERRPAAVSLADSDADDAGIVALLHKIAAFAGHRETPTVVPLDEDGARRLEALMPAVQQLADEREGAAAEWIGRGVATIVRLAGVLSLMEWAESGEKYLPVGATHIDDAYALWSDYYLPHAMAVFDRAGAGATDPAARRVVRWLRRVRPPEISREDVRRGPLCQSVDADTAEDVLAKLEAGGIVRLLSVTGSSNGGPRRRRWEVNPMLGAS